MTSPRPEPLRVQPIALQIMLYQYNCHRVMGQSDNISRPNSIVAGSESGSAKILRNIDRSDLPPPNRLCNAHISRLKSHTLSRYTPPHLRLTRSGQCRKCPEHCHRNHYETSRNIGFLPVLYHYNSYSTIILGSPKSVVPMQGHALPPPSYIHYRCMVLQRSEHHHHLTLHRHSKRMTNKRNSSCWSNDKWKRISARIYERL